MYARVNGIQLDVYEQDPATGTVVRRNPDYVRDNLLSFPAPSNLSYVVILEDKSKTRGNQVYRVHDNGTHTLVQEMHPNEARDGNPYVTLDFSTQRHKSRPAWFVTNSKGKQLISVMFRSIPDDKDHLPHSYT